MRKCQFKLTDNQGLIIQKYVDVKRERDDTLRDIFNVIFF